MIRIASLIRSRVSVRSVPVAWSTLTRFDAVPPTATISFGRASGASSIAA